MFGRPTDLGGQSMEVSAPEIEQHLQRDQAARREGETNIAALKSNPTQIEMKTDAHVLTNATSLHNGDELVLRILYYDPMPAHHVQVRLWLGRSHRRLAGG